MKPWLLNILACPIDKHHPLDTRFFSWETPPDEMRKIASEVGMVSTHFKKGYRHLAKQIKDGTISPPAIKLIEDKTESEDSKALLAEAIKALDRVKEASEQSEEEFLRNFPQEIDALYRYMNLIEVDSGILSCSKCGRWYPIGSAVETIPELLPDDLREEERDLGWMKKWRELIPLDVLKNGKPFNIGNQA